MHFLVQVFLPLCHNHRRTRHARAVCFISRYRIWRYVRGMAEGMYIDELIALVTLSAGLGVALGVGAFAFIRRRQLQETMEKL
jgi:hypothetical protein